MKVKANGIEMNYELVGNEGAQVVMLSHSLGAGLAMWEPQMESLKAHFRVLRYDTRGHGGTEAPSGAYTLEQLGDDAIGLLDVLGIDVVHWVGLSMGGMIGQCLALNDPNRLHCLVLSDTTSMVPKEAQPVWQERIDTANDKGMKALVDGTIENWFTQPYLRANPPEVQMIRQQFLATPVSGFVGCSEAIRNLNYLDRLSQIEKPTLIMVGEEDPRTPVAAAEAMHARIPNSRLVVLPSASHLSSVEQSGAFNKELVTFLKNC
jgi:3-oxoadipate enol-lactonase